MPRPALLPLARYWVPIGLQDDGVLPFDLEDESWYRLVPRPGAKPLADLAEVPCLFLLGEPGLGKSTAVRQEVARLCDALPDGEAVHARNLAEVSLDWALRDLFGDPALEAWLGDGSVLHLFLDSYDECLRRYPGLKERLLYHLRRLPLDRLRLRIACRSGEFPGHLPEELVDLWRERTPEAEGRVRLVRLVPLSPQDARQWAEAVGVDGAAFLRAVGDRNAAAFAGRPITLRTLLNRFTRGEWPETEVELYDAACLDLCSEENPERRREQQLAMEQRLAVAERIAALTTLANRDLVWLSARGDRPEGVLSVDDLAGGDEEAGGTRVPADRSAAAEVLEGCALFEVADAGLIRWSQQTYREFLAACFFARRLRNATKAIQFFEHPGRPGSTERLVAPQLAEPAAWLAHRGGAR